MIENMREYINRPVAFPYKDAIDLGEKLINDELKADDLSDDQIDVVIDYFKNKSNFILRSLAYGATSTGNILDDTVKDAVFDKVRKLEYDQRRIKELMSILTK